MKRVFPVILLILALLVTAGLAIDLPPAVAEAESDAVSPVAITSLSLIPPHSHLEIDYIDYLRLGGQTYYRVYEAVLNGPDRVGREIGRVKTTVRQLRIQLNRPEQNGDAAYLPRGTALRVVKRFPTSFLLAAADSREFGGYGVYVLSSCAHAWQYRFLPKDRVKRVTTCFTLAPIITGVPGTLLSCRPELGVIYATETSVW